MDVFKQPFDPSDINAYEVDFSGLLEEGETIDTFTVAPTAGAAEAGFGIREGGGYSTTTIGGVAVRFWPQVADEAQADARWSGAGERCPVEFTLVTTATPARTLQRRYAVRVRQM